MDLGLIEGPRSKYKEKVFPFSKHGDEEEKKTTGEKIPPQSPFSEEEMWQWVSYTTQTTAVCQGTAEQLR